MRLEMVSAFFACNTTNGEMPNLKRSTLPRISYIAGNHNGSNDTLDFGWCFSCSASAASTRLR
jgi:hypothetical protein